MSDHHSSCTDDFLSIVMLPGKGRGYIATKDIPAGCVVHIAKPLATAVSQEWIPETCMLCFDFSYPKKQKVKVMNHVEELQALFREWGQGTGSAPHKNARNNNNRKKHNVKLYKDMVFCSEVCREKYKRRGLLSNTALLEWKLSLALNLRLDEEYKNSMNVESNIVATPCSTATLGQFDISTEQWIDANDDELLLSWLDMAWSCLTKEADLYKEIDNSDRTMCRLIASCIIQKHIEDEAYREQLQDMPLSFKDIFAIQDNELTYFRSCLGNNANRLPSLNQLDRASKKSLLMSVIPIEIKEVMALYCFFQRALSDTLLHDIPTLSHVEHQLFRTIYFRERANSFGLWEHSDNSNDAINGEVTDDLELLGWGIYPTAVYFNHSCDANVKKIRDGRYIKFIARRPIVQGEEACISYGSVGETVDKRRSRLLEHYHFLCQCVRCLQEAASVRQEPEVR